MKKIAPYLLPLNMLCLFFAFILFILLLQGSTSDRIILSKDTTLHTSQNNTSITMDGKLNINSASADELMQIPGIGQTLSQRIVAYRQQNGKFNDIDELLNIKGIGEKLLQKIEQYISIGD